MLVHAGPGAGKTLGALIGFKEMQKESLLSHLIVFCHRNVIAHQWINSARLLGLNLKELDSSLEVKDTILDLDGWVITYQGASRNSKTLQENFKQIQSKIFLAVADEAHHLGVDPEQPEGLAWGKAFLDLTNFCVLRLGLTGTPFRADNLAFCAARKINFDSRNGSVEQIIPDLCVEPRELIEAGDVRPLEFHFQDGWVEHACSGVSDRETSLLSTENRETWRARNLRRAVQFSDSSSIAIQLLLRARRKLEKVRLSHRNAGGLVIARDIQHAIQIFNLLRENGDSVDLVHSDDKFANGKLVGFQNSKAKWLVSVDMCSEGFDAPRLRVIAYLTTVATRSRFLQAITRCVRISSERAVLEALPRELSYVFSPADPLLMQYARCWSISEPYLIQGKAKRLSTGLDHLTTRNLTLPLEAVEDVAGGLIKMGSVELPSFLKT